MSIKKSSSSKTKAVYSADNSFCTARVDVGREKRRGFPEVIYCPGKTLRQIEKISRCILAHNDTLLLTRADAKIYRAIKKISSRAVFNEIAGLVYVRCRERGKKTGLVLVISAGTGDIPVAEEAAVTAELAGSRVERLYDVGVAGIHRLLEHDKLLQKASVLVVAAGMEGALASVVSGLVKKPVIGVPTSIGYGASFQGLAPLLTMLNSCSPGVCVVNIDNGFGAGYLAAMINK